MSTFKKKIDQAESWGELLPLVGGILMMSFLKVMALTLAAFGLLTLFMVSMPIWQIAAMAVVLSSCDLIVTSGIRMLLS
ncbi:MAG: hypothetical protein ACFB0G_11195 [Leptolyngbyaceae cyanobacterium]